ncbi:bacteriophage abortive infection AbiH family protein [Autumnicola musiva]|uniref:Bacteriophage abortive infection AbiH family protein n=1 Tax=Autumnicola musiva TaxID=3075589 RepID=A0ABU3D4L9_9FLAO|nr:bacteriophage abortive infection AbiH family protein [Zunongwangia sp. F117]MDT0676477.1 bacteriophage abortive infection AbiH family protein [Zunongwangia sp. F117]
MNKLYIIGNGFDLYHCLDTWYSSFGIYLQKTDEETYDHLLEYLYLPELDEEDEVSLKDPLWSTFENSLAGLDIEEVLEKFSEYSANPGSDDFSDGDWDTIRVYVSEVKKHLTDKLLENFKTFVQNVHYPDTDDLTLLNLEENAIYLNFNYTKTLELYYNIPSDQILYIHNKADGISPLILGHGLHPEKFRKEEPKMPENMSLEEQEQWMDFQSNNYDLSIENGRDELIDYFQTTFKSTEKIISNNISFFNSLKSIQEINVLGHSISQVDALYFKTIIGMPNKNKITWNVSYHKEDEKLKKKQSLIDLGLDASQINLCKMEDFI